MLASVSPAKPTRSKPAVPSSSSCKWTNRLCNYGFLCKRNAGDGAAKYKWIACTDSTDLDSVDAARAKAMKFLDGDDTMGCDVDDS